MLIYNASIYTLDDEQPEAHYLLLENGHIAACGQGTPDTALFERARESVDLQGKAVCPAFCDPHIHVWKVGLLRTDWLDVRGMRSLEELKDALATFAASHSDHEWIVARGFNEQLFASKQVPTRVDLDDLGLARPVFLMRTCAHQVIVNSHALLRCNIQSANQAPPGGLIECDSQGNLNGRFHETAIGLLLPHLPAWTTQDYQRYITAASAELLRHGVVAACDPGVGPELLETYVRMADERSLPLKMNVMPLGMDDAGDLLEVPAPHTLDQLSISIVKFFADGALSGKTAALKRQYPTSDTMGVLRLDQESYLQRCLELLEKGYGIATHAIGDRAIDQVLTVYEQLRRVSTECILRIEHCGLPDAAMMMRMASARVGVAMQPLFLPELGANLTVNLTTDYQERCYPLQSLLDHGISCAISTDAPVVQELRPLQSIEAAYTRSDGHGSTIAPHESVTRRQGLALCTRDVTALGDYGTYCGILKEGAPGDLVILDCTGFDWLSDTAQLPDVAETYVHGTSVFNKEDEG